MLAGHDSYYSQNDVINLINNNIHQNIPLMTIYSIMEEKNVLILLVVCHSYQINVSIVATKARKSIHFHRLIQFSSVAQSCLTLCDPMSRSTPDRPVHHQLPEFTQTHVHQVGDTIQPSHPLFSPSPPAPNPSQYQGFCQWVNMRWPKYWSFSFSISPSNDRIISKYTHRLISMSIFSNESIISNKCIY